MGTIRVSIAAPQPAPPPVINSVFVSTDSGNRVVEIVPFWGNVKFGAGIKIFSKSHAFVDAVIDNPKDWADFVIACERMGHQQFGKLAFGDALLNARREK